MTNISKNKIVIYSYYSPEEITGIGKYNGELIEWLCDNNYEVVSISNVPFYPHWKKYKGHRNRLIQSRKGRFLDIRSWVYIPRQPSTAKKIVSELSFLLSSSTALITHLGKIRNAKLFIVIAPPFFLGSFAIFLSKVLRISTLYHIQDLQIDAARELGLLPNRLCSVIEKIEVFILNHVDFISTISHGMAEKISKKKIKRAVQLIPNWSNLEQIKPTFAESNWLHKEVGIDESKKLIVYSGNIGEKQGLEILLETAKDLEEVKDLQFLILGEGLYKRTLKEKIDRLELENISLNGLVPTKKLNNMLNSSFIQLVIQKSTAADSFLPSKLTNILAAGCVSIVTAEANTSLYKILSPTKTAKIIKPDSSQELTKAIMEIYDSEIHQRKYSIAARKWAEKNLSIEHCLKSLKEILSKN